MNDLIDQYKAQIEALQRELERKTKLIDKAYALIYELYDAMAIEQIINENSKEV